MSDQKHFRSVEHFHRHAENVAGAALGSRRNRPVACSKTLLAVCGATHRESYFDIAMVGIVGPLIALAVIIVLGSAIGSF